MAAMSLRIIDVPSFQDSSLALSVLGMADAVLRSDNTSARQIILAAAEIVGHAAHVLKRPGRRANLGKSGAE